jgi:hypothetical protein
VGNTVRCAWPRMVATCTEERSAAKIFRDVSYCHKAKDAHRGQAAACLRALSGGNKQSRARVAGVALGFCPTRAWLSLAEGALPMTNSRKIITAALAATMAITTLSISTPASAWGRYGGGWGHRHWGSGWGYRHAGWRPTWGYGRWGYAGRRPGWGYGRWGYGGMALGAAASYPYNYGSYGSYGSAYPSGCGSYGSGNYGNYGYSGSGNYGYSGAGYSAPVANEGYYCATSEKTCLLNEPGWLGTGCSCKVLGGRARGIVE